MQVRQPNACVPGCRGNKTQKLPEAGTNQLPLPWVRALRLLPNFSAFLDKLTHSLPLTRPLGLPNIRAVQATCRCCGRLAYLTELPECFRRLLIVQPANAQLSNPLPCGSGRGRSDDRKR